MNIQCSRCGKEFPKKKLEKNPFDSRFTCSPCIEVMKYYFNWVCDYRWLKERLYLK